MAERYCLEYGCPNLTTKRRCPTHQKAWEKDRARRLPQRSAYTDPAYIKAKKLIKGKPCALRLPNICTIWATTINHIVPLSKGGSNTPANYEPSCLSCNSSKREGRDAKS